MMDEVLSDKTVHIVASITLGDKLLLLYEWVVLGQIQLQEIIIDDGPSV